MAYRKEIIGDAVLYLGDALDVLQTIPSVRAQALIADPPYCSGGFTEAAKRSAKGQACALKPCATAIGSAATI